MSISRVSFMAAALTACLAAPVAAEDARQIFDAARKAYEQRVAAVDSVTLVQETMGVESTTRLTKMVADDGEYVEMGGQLSSTYRHFDQMAKSAEVRGTEQVDGHPCWVVDVADLGGTRINAEGAADFEAQDGTLYVDKEQLVVRRMLMNGVTRRRGAKTPFSMEMQLKDYREVKGWIHPFRTEITLRGGGDGAPSDDMAAMRQGMAELEKHLASMPPEQRRQMEQMMKGRIPEFEQTDEGDAMKVTVIVKEIRVNEPAN